MIWFIMAVPEGSIYERAESSVRAIRGVVPSNLQNPLIGIICGSGLSRMSSSVHPDDQVELSYSTIPHFSQSTGKDANGVTNIG